MSSDIPPDSRASIELVKHDLRMIATYFEKVGPNDDSPWSPDFRHEYGPLPHHMHYGAIRNIHLIHKPMGGGHVRSYLYFELQTRVAPYTYSGWVLYFQKSSIGVLECMVPRLLPVEGSTGDKEVDSRTRIGISALQDRASITATFPVLQDSNTPTTARFGSIIGTLWGRRSGSFLAGVNLLALMLDRPAKTYSDAITQFFVRMAFAGQVSWTSRKIVVEKPFQEQWSSFFGGHPQELHFHEIIAISFREIPRGYKLGITPIRRRKWDVMTPEYNKGQKTKDDNFRVEIFAVPDGDTIYYLPYEVKDDMGPHIAISCQESSGGMEFPDTLMPRTFTRDAILKAASSPLDGSVLSSGMSKSLSQVMMKYIYNFGREPRYHEAVLHVFFERGFISRWRGREYYYQSCFIRAGIQTASLQLEFPGELGNGRSGAVDGGWMTAWFSFPISTGKDVKLSDLLCHMFGRCWPGEVSPEKEGTPAELGDLTRFQVSKGCDTRYAVRQWFLRLHEAGFVGLVCDGTDYRLDAKFVQRPLDFIISYLTLDSRVASSRNWHQNTIVLQKRNIIAGTFIDATHSAVKKARVVKELGSATNGTSNLRAAPAIVASRRATELRVSERRQQTSFPNPASQSSGQLQKRGIRDGHSSPGGLADRNTSFGNQFVSDTSKDTGTGSLGQPDLVFDYPIATDPLAPVGLSAPVFDYQFMNLPASSGYSDAGLNYQNPFDSSHIIPWEFTPSLVSSLDPSPAYGQDLGTAPGIDVSMPPVANLSTNVTFPQSALPVPDFTQFPSYPMVDIDTQLLYDTQPTPSGPRVAVPAQQQPSATSLTYRTSNHLQGSFFPKPPQQPPTNYFQVLPVNDFQRQQQGRKSTPGGYRGGRLGDNQDDPATKRLKPATSFSQSSSGQGGQYNYGQGESSSCSGNTSHPSGHAHGRHHQL